MNTPVPPRTEAADSEALLRRLEWTVIRRLDGLLQGDYRTLMRGAGLDLADLREYQHHDDVRHIDWNVTARLQQPYVRQFTEDRELAAWFLVDLSASVDFGSDTRAKRAVARNYIKRTIREVFRLQQPALDGVDFVVRARERFDRAQGQAVGGADPGDGGQPGADRSGLGLRRLSGGRCRPGAGRGPSARAVFKG